MADHSSFTSPFEHESLRLVTTNAKFLTDSLFIDTGETSAATAQAARMAAIICAEYPDFWAETVRGLLVHSAEWTSQMISNYEQPMTKRNLENMLRSCGYGVPSLEKALYSAGNSLTLITQNSLIPFMKENSQIKTNEMHLHELPWSQDILSDLGELEVKMRITLSYFIEPNPSRRGYNHKHRYASHRLRFTTNAPTETIENFRQRINKVSRLESDSDYSSSSDADRWVLGPQICTKGSLHSDIWRGTAAELAAKKYIAVYPVSGWWKELKKEEKWDSAAPYSLIVTIETPRTEIDIYNRIANIITV